MPAMPVALTEWQLAGAKRPLGTGSLSPLSDTLALALSEPGQ